MNFEFSEEQDLLRDHAQRFLMDNCPMSNVRRVVDGSETWDAGLWQSVCEMGWTATVIPEEYGGLGLSYIELSVLAEEMGRSLAPIPFSSSVYLATEAILIAGTEEQKKRYLPKLASGSAIGCLAVVEGPGEVTPDTLDTIADENGLTGTKLPVLDGNVADLAIVIAASSNAGASAFLVDLHQENVVIEVVGTIDPSRSQARIVFDCADAEPLGASGEGCSLLRQIYDRAAVLFAWEQVGGADTALQMARDYAMERIAFGRPIGSFQAIKHKLAHAYVKNTLARSNCYYGAWALEESAQELPIAAATARISAIQAYYYASKENIQTHGGMGFTWEFDCHFPYRRSKVLATVIGSERTWQEKLISALEARRAA